MAQKTKEHKQQLLYVWFLAIWHAFWFIVLTTIEVLKALGIIEIPPIVLISIK